MLEQVLQKNSELLAENNRLLTRLVELNSLGCRCDSTPVTPEKVNEAIKAEARAAKQAEAKAKADADADAADAEIKAENAKLEAENAPATTAPEYKLDDVRMAIMRYHEAKGKPATIRLMARFNATKASEIVPTDYAAVIEDVNAGMKGAA